MKILKKIPITLQNKIKYITFFFICGMLLNTYSNLSSSKLFSFIEAPSATISVSSNEVCKGESVTITFTGSGGTAPYTFTYTENDIEKTEVTEDTNDSISFSFSSSAPNDYVFILREVKDVSDPQQVVILDDKETITVTTPPSVDFSFDNNVCSGETVQFTNTSMGEGTLTYEWDFDDGNTSSSKNPRNVFDAFGCDTKTFNVTLTATDGNGCSFSKTHSVKVIEKPNFDIFDEVDGDVNFSKCGNTSSSLPDFEISVDLGNGLSCITNYNIKWGDGSEDDTNSFPITHNYDSLGLFSMIVTATSSNGCSTVFETIVKNISNPSGSIVNPGSTQNICAPTEAIPFVISSWGKNSIDTKYEVNYGDGTPIETYTQSELEASIYFNSTNPANSENYPISHVYTDSSCPIAYTASLDVINACGTTPSLLPDISVLGRPKLAFSFIEKSCINKPIIFNNNSIYGDGEDCDTSGRFKWDFGDGTISGSSTELADQTHSYTAPGKYIVKLSAISFCGPVEITKEICIEPEITPTFSVDNEEGCIPLNISATNTTDELELCSDPRYEWIVNYAEDNCGDFEDWEFVNDTDALSENPEFIFKNPGKYTLTQRIITGCGTETAIKIIDVKKPPTAIIQEIDDTCGSITFTPIATVENCTSNTSGINYNWTFIGGTPANSTALEPGDIAYTVPGVYEVTLKVTSECGVSNTAIRSFEIFETPIITNTNVTQEICSGQSTSEIILTASNTSATFTWEANSTGGIAGFPTNGTSGIIPAQTFINLGNTPETVTYTVVPSIDGCVGDAVSFVVTVNPSPAISTQPTSSDICVNGAATPLEVTYESGTGTPAYQWFTNTTNTNSGGIEITDATAASYNPLTNIVGETFYYVEISFSSGGCAQIISNTASVIVQPQIVVNPIADPQVICVGGMANEMEVTFSGGTGVASYQWFSNLANINTGGDPIVGATNSSYTPDANTFINAGDFYYYVEISLDGEGCNAAPSEVYEINVLADPIIDTQAIDEQELCQNATPEDLSVTVSGGTTSDKTYQWYQNTDNNTTSGTAISSANSSTYTPETSSIGTVYYYVTISQTESGCSVTSATSELKVNEAPTFTTEPTSSEICLDGAATPLEVAYENGTGVPAYQWFSNLDDNITSGNSIAGAIDLTYNPPTDAEGTIYYYAEISFSSGGCSQIISNTASVIVQPQIVVNPIADPQVICLGGTANEMEITFSGGTGVASYQWFSNPANINTGGDLIPGATNSSYTPDANTFINAGDFYYYVEISLDGEGCNATSSEVYEIIVLSDPIIDTQVLDSQELCQNATPTDLSVTVSGGTTSDKTYQWYQNTDNNTISGTVISSANTSTYTPETSTVGIVYYYVIVSQSESGCRVTSAISELKVNEAPTFTIQPTSSEICLNGTAAPLEVAYENGTGVSAYQWFSNTDDNNSGGEIIADATGTSYNPVTNIVGETFYYAEISFSSGGCSQIISKTASVIVEPQIVVNPIADSQVICAGGTANEMEVTFSGGTGVASYQWFSNTTRANTDGTLIVGATNNTYTPNVFSTVDNFYFYVEISLDGNGCSTATSDVFEINVLADPIIDEQPIVLQELCQNATPTDLFIAVSGGTSAAKTFQWFSNTTNSNAGGTVILGETSDIFTPPTSIVGTVFYYVTISQAESGCSVTSATSELKVNEAPTFTTQPTSSEICLDGAATPLEVAYENGTGVPAYQWFSNLDDNITSGNSIAGAIDLTYNPPTDAVGTIYYYAEISFSSGGCSQIISNTASVIVQPQIVVNPIADPQVICVGGTANEMEVTFSGGTGIVSYQWFSNASNSNLGGAILTGETASKFTPNLFTSAGVFYFYAEVFLDGNGCSLALSDVFEINVLADPVIDEQPIVSQELCQNATPTDLFIAVSGGTSAAKTFQWFSNTTNSNVGGIVILGETSDIFTPPTSIVGTVFYYVTISQTESGCSVTSATSELKVNEAPTFTTQPTSSEICLDGTATLLEVAYENGTGPVIYQWFSNTNDNNSGGDIIVDATDTSYNPPTSNVGETFYYVEISFSTGGCDQIVSNTASVVVDEIPLISAAEITIYSEETFNFDPNTIAGNTIPDGTKYTWTSPTFNPAGAIIGASAETNPQDQISQTLENTGTSPVKVIYTITSATAKCTGDVFILEVTVNPSINSNTEVINNSCFESNDASIVTSIIGGVPFETGNPYFIYWTGPNGFTETNTTIINLEAGLYILRIEDSSGFFMTEEWRVTQPDLLVITKDVEKNISCFQGNDGEIAITVSGGTLPYTVNWTSSDGSGIVLNAENQNILTAGAYRVEIIDKNNCTIATDIILTEPEELKIERTFKQDVLCFGDATGAFEIDVSGGTKIEISPGVFDYIYNWSGPNGFTSSSKNINNLIAGNYTIAVTDNLGCTTNTDIIINQFSEIEINYTKTDVTCYGETNGSIDVSVIGGQAPHRISWSSLANGFSLSDLSADTYIATITDDNNCVKQVSITIEQPIFYIDPVVNFISCNGENDGAIDLNLTGGIAPFSVTWNDDASAGVQRNNLAAGTYTVLILDSDVNQCPIAETFIFTNPPAIAVSATVVDAIDCDIVNSGRIDLEISGGSIPYSFLWSNNETTEDLENIPPGDYSVEITDENGCLVVRQFNIFRQEPINITFEETTITDCDLKIVSKQTEAIVTGGYLPYSYSWTAGTVSEPDNTMMTSSQNGSYVLTVTDKEGCTESKSLIIDVPTIGDIDFSYSAFALATYDFLSIEDPIQFTNLSTGDFTSVKWDFGDGSPTSNEENPIHTYDGVGSFKVVLTIVFNGGCTEVFERTVAITQGYSLIHPTAFTPNNDGYNETIRPSYRGFTDLKMMIYDTWGTVVYSEEGINLKGWDGFIGGKPGENGNYVMVVKGITFYEKEIIKSSPVTLLK